MLRINLLVFLLVCFEYCFSQNPYHYSLTITPETCLKGAATIEISGLDPKDSLEIYWSTGKRNSNSVTNLISGEYFVESKIISHHDSLRLVNDTSLFFKVEKVICEVTIDTYFSPNDDGYHDVLGISNVQYYPDFEFVIFNKWGQQIHSQKNTYKAWDGKWNGAEVPDGSYYYIFFFNSADKNNLIKGNVAILR